jgi:hypothetical protein
MSDEAEAVGPQRHAHEAFLLHGLCECAETGSTLYLTGGSRRTPFYACRGLTCGARAYARADDLDSHVLAVH